MPGYALPVIEVLHVFSNGSLAQTPLFLRESQSFNVSEEEAVSVIVSPNPIISNLMTVNQPLENVYLYLFSVTGELVLNQRLVKGDNQIDVSTLPVGLYTYRIVGKDSRVLVEEKVMKT